MKDTMSLYKTMKAQAPSREIGLDAYCGFVKMGAYQDNVIEGRAHRARAKVHQKSDPDYALYLECKQRQECVTGSAVMNDGSKHEDNIKSMNGLIVIDVDTEVNGTLVQTLRADQYTRVLHRSFGGDGVCIFVRINQLKDFRDSFEGLAQYYLDNYGVKVDASCSNPNRLRYMSYDIDLFENDKSKVFTHKAKKKEPKPAELNYIFAQDDFDFILEQIKEKHVDLCDEDYSRYVKIGMGLANKFGEAGREKYHFICSFGSKYNPKDTDRDYNGFVKSNSGKCSIASLYYYAKEAGLELYSKKTKQIINRVKIAKSQGSPTVESVKTSMLNIHDVEVNGSDIQLIKDLIESKIDYSVNANAEQSKMEQLENFIIGNFQPVRDFIGGHIYLNGNDKPVNDQNKNDVYIACSKHLDFSVFNADVKMIMNSSAVKEVNPVADFFKNNKTNEVGLIEQYARCIQPEKDYNVWAFTKWMVGAVHNWTADFYEDLVSPLTFVLTGEQHGTGKSSFFKNVLPPDLKKYFANNKLDIKEKDSVYNMATRLILFDDEFGGNAIKDVKNYKAISDITIITQRRPYGSTIEDFKRRASLCGASNELDILKDATGNRRILPAMVESIRYDEMKTIDTSKMWAEAYNLYINGFDWIIRTQEDIDYIKANTGENEEVDPIEEVFFNTFSLVKEKGKEHARVFNQGDFLEYFSTFSTVRITGRDIKRILTKNKMKQKNIKIHDSKQKKGYLVFMGKSEGDTRYNCRPLSDR